MINVKNILLGFTIISSMACAISKNEKDPISKTNGQQAVANNTLAKDSISHDNLKHFEDRAIQKVIDFYDYIDILGHDDFNNAIKDKVRSSAEALFYNPQSLVDPFADPNGTGLTSLHLLLQEMDIENAPPELDILNIEIIEKFKLINESHYAGTMQLDIRNKSASIIITKEIDFSLRKIEKKFGNETMEIWEAFIDKIQ